MQTTPTLRSLMRAVAIALLSVLVTASTMSSQEPRTQPHMEALASKIAAKLKKAHLHRVLLAPFKICDKIAETCTYFDGEFAEALERVAPDLEIVPRDRVVTLLEQHQAPAGDAKDPMVLLYVALRVGADAVLVAGAEDTPDTVKLRITLHDASKDVPAPKLSEERGEIPHPEILSTAQAVPFQDPRTGAYTSGMRGVGFPKCQYCPLPKYSDDLRRRKIQGVMAVVATISVEGHAQDVLVLGGGDPELMRLARITVDGWRFIPAKGPDGKPVPTRIVIEVTFRLL